MNKLLNKKRNLSTYITPRQSFYDDFRYVNFSRAHVNIGEGFDIKDGIFRVGVTGLYMFTVHALPMAEQPFMVQIRHNGQSVAAFSNGKQGKNFNLHKWKGVKDFIIAIIFHICI